MRISLVAAVAENGVIGRAGDLPWRLREDLRRFRALTTGHTVIVGRKTQESIVRRLGRALPDRRTIVVTRQEGYGAPEADVVHSLEEALARAQGEAEVFVIGGAEIFTQALPTASRIYLTRVHARPAGDTFFPPLDPGEWVVTRTEHYRQDEHNDFDYTFEVLERREQSG